MADSDVQEMSTSPTDSLGVITTHLTAIGIPQPDASRYATKLANEGFDTVEIFDSLSGDDLTQDFAFKRGHVIAVEKFRTSTTCDQGP